MPLGISNPLPLSSFLLFLDLKTGVQLAVYFALLNKLAGTYGLLAIFTGASLPQLGLYLYCLGGLFVYLWALKVVQAENPEKTGIVAHLFLVDHIVSTLYTAFFGVAWYVFTPHDGRRIINSAAQVELATGAAAVGHHPPTMSEAQRAVSATQLWNQEKTLAAEIIILGWIFKLYLCFVLYSYAYHLRNGSYRHLPLSKPSKLEDQYPESPGLSAVDQEHDGSVLYKPADATGIAATPLTGRPSSSRHTPMLSGASFTEFVGAHNSRNNGWPEPLDEVDEVVFDEEEARAEAQTKNPEATS